jgi:hypothetical protein
VLLRSFRASSVTLVRTGLGEVIAVAERLFTIPLTHDGFPRIAHEVTDEVFQAGEDGLYIAVCGAEVRVVSAMEPPGRPCGSCLVLVAAARRAATAPVTAAIPEQSRGRRRRGVLALLHGGRR